MTTHSQQPKSEATHAHHINGDQGDPENHATQGHDTGGHDTENRDLEHRYYQYLRAQSYVTEAALLDVLGCYLPFFNGFTRVLDIGCGHGEFLQLLQANGHEASGVDIDPAMIKTCTAHGLTAVEADAIPWLATQVGQFDAIFSSNVIEHMDAQSVQQLIHHAYHALRPGGMLLLGTPNPESLIVQFHEFWRDPTHVRLYDRQLLEFFFHAAGFTAIKNGNNTAAIWDGVDQMVDPNLYPAPEGDIATNIATTIFADEGSPASLRPMLAELHPMPQPPSPTAPLRQRLVFRLVQFVYQKFLEPYIALLRHDLAEQRQYSLALFDYATQLRTANTQLANTLQTTIKQQEARFQQIGHGFRFLYPAREFFVYGYKPPITNPLADLAVDPAAASPVDGDIPTTDEPGFTPIDHQSPADPQV